MAPDEQPEREGSTAMHVGSVARLVVIALASACGSGGGTATTDAAPRCTQDLHDEDGDGVVDDCDNCPAAANPGQEDTTEVAVHAFDDGVGDACDFRPGLSGDTLVAFYPWADAAELNSWTATGATVDADALQISGDARLEGKRSVAGDGVIVTVQVPELAWNVVGAGSLAIAIDGDGITAGDVCTLRAAAGGGEELVAQELAGGATTSKLVAGDASHGQQLVAWRRLTNASNEIACRVIRGKTQTEVVVPLVDDLVIGAYAIAATGVTLRSSSVSVLSTPGPKTP